MIRGLMTDKFNSKFLLWKPSTVSFGKWCEITTRKNDEPCIPQIPKILPTVVSKMHGATDCSCIIPLSASAGAVEHQRNITLGREREINGVYSTSIYMGASRYLLVISTYSPNYCNHTIMLPSAEWPVFLRYFMCPSLLFFNLGLVVRKST